MDWIFFSSTPSKGGPMVDFVKGFWESLFGSPRRKEVILVREFCVLQNPKDPRSGEREEIVGNLQCIGEVDPQGIFLPSGPPPMRLK